MLTRERDQFFGPLLVSLRLPATIVEYASKAQDKGQTRRMSQLPGVREGLLASLQRLRRIAEEPQHHSQVHLAGSPGVLPVQQGVGLVLLGVIERQALLQMFPGSHELAKIQQGDSPDAVRPDEQPRILYTLGQTQQLPAQI